MSPQVRGRRKAELQQDFLANRGVNTSSIIEKYKQAIEEKRKLVEKKEQEYESINLDDPYKKYEKYFKYQNDPIGFVENELGIILWDKQREMLQMLTVPPYRVFSCASHGVGKTFLAACATLWMAFCFPDSIVLTTAPTQTQVENLLWRTIRAINNIDSDIFIGKKAPGYEINKKWFGLGRTPSSGDAFQGFHAPHQLIIIDEAVGVPQYVWEAIHGMDNDSTRILAICNPTDTTSYAYQEYISGQYETIHISGMEHPNVTNWFSGKPGVYPGAIQGEHWFNLFKKWSDKVEERFKRDSDVECPPGSGEYYRPGALALARLLGKWPLESGDSFFSELHVERLFGQEFVYKDDKLKNAHSVYAWDQDLQIGVDIARGGQDFSCLSIRYKGTIINHYRVNGYDSVNLANFIIEIVKDLSEFYEIYEYDIAIAIDVTGLGVGVFDILAGQGYNVAEINFSGKPFDPDKYVNIRTELYGLFADRCKNNEIKLAPELVEEYGHLVKLQLMGAVYTYNKTGKFILRPKDTIRKEIGMSPDDTDAMCLACYPFYNRLTVIVDDQNLI